MIFIKEYNFKKTLNTSISCDKCRLGRLCLPDGLNKNQMSKLDKIISRKKPYQRGDYLFRNGDILHSVYAIHSGSIKTYSMQNDGKIQINGFLLSGEIAGLEGIANNCHSVDAVALETTSVCEIPFKQLESLSVEIPKLQHQMFKVLSNEIKHEQTLASLLGRKTAEQRLAAFLLSLSLRFECRNFSANTFNLSMSRSDIANYLGLAVETVSRIITRLSDNKILSVKRKMVSIYDKKKLYQMAGIISQPPNVIRKTGT